ncbi:MAG: restriction endonuclease subunit S [Lachnospiraceae bacterium]|nr:restriction endonuclease subunit S [Lachnospiraceae bacterium]
MNNRKTPIIRFKGFTDDWEQRKLSDLVQIERGGSPRPIDDYITDASNGLNWIKIGDAPAQGNYITKTAEKIRPEGLSKTREVHPGDLILSNSMSFGKPYIMGIYGCIHDGWLLIRNTYNFFDLTFLCHLLGTPQMLNQYRSLAAGSTVNNLNKELVGNTVVTIPNIDEQRVIGQYSEHLDHLITLHQRKLEKLKIVKKAMLENCFPKKGKKVPKFRFSGFTGDWEQRKLGKVFEEYSEKNHEDLPTLMIIQGGGTIRRDESDRSLLYDKANLANYKMVNEGDFIVHLRSFEGGLEMATNTGIISPAYHTFHGENTDSRFYYSYFRSKKFIDIDLTPHVYGIRDGRSIDIEGMKTVKIPFTSYEEQKAIGMFIKHLDHLITLHQRKLEKLKIIKKSFLEKMFV